MNEEDVLYLKKEEFDNTKDGKCVALSRCMLGEDEQEEDEEVTFNERSLHEMNQSVLSTSLEPMENVSKEIDTTFEDTDDECVEHMTSPVSRPDITPEIIHQIITIMKRFLKSIGYGDPSLKSKKLNSTAVHSVSNSNKKQKNNQGRSSAPISIQSLAVLREGTDLQKFELSKKRRQSSRCRIKFMDDKLDRIEDCSRKTRQSSSILANFKYFKR